MKTREVAIQKRIERERIEKARELRRDMRNVCSLLLEVRSVLGFLLTLILLF